MKIRTVACAALALLATPASAAAASPHVETMVVGRTAVRAPARTVTAKATRVSGCRVGAATPLAALRATHLSLTLTDDGGCSPSALYVSAIAGERARGQAGWVYKVGVRSGTTSAADPSGSFGTGRRLRSGDRVLWFWCVRASSCQRTLDVAARRTGPDVVVSVRAYDDQGRGVAVAGATVDAGGARAITGPDGRATVRASRAVRVVATKGGMVRSFPERVA